MAFSLTNVPRKVWPLPRYALIPSLQTRPGVATVICCEREALELPQLCRNFLQLSFDDITEAQVKEAGDEPKVSALIRPTQQHVKQALQFARAHPAPTLFVCCHAGISRSPAIAWAILWDQTRDLKVATEDLFRIAPFSLPHRDIIRYALQSTLPESEVPTMLQQAEALISQAEKGNSAGTVF